MSSLREVDLPPNQADYVRRVEALLRSFNQLSEQQVQAALSLLADARRRVIEQLAALPLNPDNTFRPDQLRLLHLAIDQEAQRFAQRYGAQLRGGLEQAWTAGVDFMPEALRSAGILTLTLAPVISRAQLEVTTQLSADLIRRVSQELITQVSREVSLGVLGGRTFPQVMQTISSLLRTEPGRQDKQLGPIAYQSERIARTEIGRTFSLANQLRHEEIAGAVPDIRKVWRTAHDGRVRETHAVAGLAYAPGGSPGPIPQAQRYRVGGEALRYPHDPAGSARNVINCRCVSILWSPAWAA